MNKYIDIIEIKRASSEITHNFLRFIYLNFALEISLLFVASNNQIGYRSKNIIGYTISDFFNQSYSVNSIVLIKCIYPTNSYDHISDISIFELD